MLGDGDGNDNIISDAFEAVSGIYIDASGSFRRWWYTPLRPRFRFPKNPSTEFVEMHTPSS
jgi:hypothetical protein